MVRISIRATMKYTKAILYLHDQQNPYQSSIYFKYFARMPEYFSPGECQTIGFSSYQLHRISHSVHENILLQCANLLQLKNMAETRSSELSLLCCSSPCSRIPQNRSFNVLTVIFLIANDTFGILCKIYIHQIKWKQRKQYEAA